MPHDTETALAVVGGAAVILIVVINRHVHPWRLIDVHTCKRDKTVSICMDLNQLLHLEPIHHNHSHNIEINYCTSSPLTIF
jgi:hypothetical protein